MQAPSIPLSCYANDTQTPCGKAHIATMIEPSSSNMESNEQTVITATIFSLFITVSLYRLVSFIILGQYPTVLRSDVLGRGKFLVVVIIVQCVISMGLPTLFLILYMVYSGLWGIYLLLSIVICTMLQEVIPRQEYMSND